MNEGKPKQILIIAPDLIGESLAIQLSDSKVPLEIALSKEKLTRHPSLVVFFIESIELPASLEIELIRLKDRWHPSPLLIVLPRRLSLNTQELLNLNCAGLIQDPNSEVLKNSIKTVLEGGRVVKLKENVSVKNKLNIPILGLGQWLLISGVHQIDSDLDSIEKLLNTSKKNPIIELVLQGRKRELNQAKYILHYLWGLPEKSIKKINQDNSLSNQDTNEYKTNITLTKKDSSTVWKEIFARLADTINVDIINSSGCLLAIDAIKPIYQKELFHSLLKQLDRVIIKINDSKTDESKTLLLWNDLQITLRKESIRSLIGSYLRLQLNGEQVIVEEELINRIDLTELDEELPNPTLFLHPLIHSKSLLLEGKLLPIDDPRALIHVEILISNWLIRTAEVLSSELINVCSEWSDLRHFLLNQNLVPTRELDRLRNQLNSQSQIQNLIKRPIRLYESKRQLYKFNKNEIETIFFVEARDDELQSLGWLQQQVALLIEARDAISPQLQSLIKYIGDLMVVLLTKVIGRAIGLVGKGIAQGMGRTFSRG
ncbi:DUF3685 domain-containing protein [Prochlorococcus sp. MIT 1223]|uniref:DUF3685 domain-containing protein n=1 Tax=Prochlorococcus sp. MIT 1223 TaxID=3096217 RepID=UPI002A753627|nr:DUF3685 domain-containing protein [Prochlorococcus sp. MIT 1223]